MIYNYFDSSCRIIVDEFNYLVQGLDVRQKEQYAIDKLCEADLVFRLGNPFRQLARYTVQGSKGQDIIVDYKDFRVEVKYWRYWFGGTGKQKLVWKDAFQKDFDWLCNQIDDGQKGKRAFIGCWSPLIGWNELLQLGSSTGTNPAPNMERLSLLPFVECTGKGVADLRTRYSENQGSFTLSERGTKVNWSLYGLPSDFINMVMYY